MTKLPPQAAPARQAPPPNPGTVIGAIPRDQLKPGEDGLTDLEREALAKTDWDPAKDPIPNMQDTAFAKKLAAGAEQVAAAAVPTPGELPDIDPTTPPLDVPEARDIADLAPEERASVEAGLVELQELQDRLNQARITPETPAEGVDMTIPGMQQAWQTAQGGIPVVDDLSGAEKLSAERPDETTDGQLASPETVEDEPAAVPAHSDLLVYVQTVLGGQRFTKRYELLGGALNIVFRSLTIAEDEHITAVVQDELMSGKLLSKAETHRRRAEYRMVAALQIVETDSAITIPQAADYQYEQTEACRSPIVAMRRDIFDKLFVTDTVRRLVAHSWNQFRALLQTLEQKAGDPNFWQAIE